MIVEICFLDEAGNLSCSLAAHFLNADHVTGYVRGILETPMMRSRIARVEVYSERLSLPFVVMGNHNASPAAIHALLKSRIAPRLNRPAPQCQPDNPINKSSSALKYAGHGPATAPV